MLVIRSKKYLKSLKRVLASGRVAIEEIDAVIDLIAKNSKLPISYRDHSLVGELKGFRECHIKPDLLLIYKIEKKILVLILVDIGSHSDLFK